MTLDTTRFERRGFLRGAGVAGLGLTGLTGAATAKPGEGNGGRNGKGSSDAQGKGGEPLKPVPINFNLYWHLGTPADESSDPDQKGDYGYQSMPDGSDRLSTGAGGRFLKLADPVGDLFFDVGEMRLTPNKKTIHHSLRFFLGTVIQNSPKPYVLVDDNSEKGLYSSRGQVMNFKAKPTPEIFSSIESKLEDIPGISELPKGTDPTPLVILGGGQKGKGNRKWRAVGTDRVKLRVNSNGIQAIPEWALTRVDFFTRGGGPPSYKLSILYVIWSMGLGKSVPSEQNDDVLDVIESGRMNMGGQSKKN